MFAPLAFLRDKFSLRNAYFSGFFWISLFASHSYSQTRGHEALVGFSYCKSDNCARGENASKITTFGQFFEFLYSDPGFRKDIPDTCPARVSQIITERAAASELGDSVQFSEELRNKLLLEDLILGEYFEKLFHQYFSCLSDTQFNYLIKKFEEFSVRGYRLYPASASFTPHVLNPSENVQDGFQWVDRVELDEDDDWEVIESIKSADTDSLICRSVAGQSFLNSVLTESLYANILQMNDLSYALANLQSSKDNNKLNGLNKRLNSISDELTKVGWNDYSVVFGKTGSDNQNDDASLVYSYNKNLNIILIAFHGSRNGSKVPIFNSGEGDWGANFASDPISLASLGVQNISADVRVHGGFGRNFQSVQERVYDLIKGNLKDLSEQELKQTWIIFTGHSKGAAMASIAASVIKHFMSHDDENRLYRTVKLGAVLFSSPRAFHGDSAQKWVHDTVGVRNILRINVKGDVVPSVPLKYDGYRSVGKLFLDEINSVNQRTGCFSSSTGWLSYLFDVNAWAGYHYANSFRSLGLEFDPGAVLPYSDLIEALTRGRLHQTQK